MNNKEKVKKLSLREIPSVDEIIIHFQQLVITIPYALCIKNIRKTLNSIRKEIRQGLIKENIRKYTFRQIEVNLIQASNSNMTSVINGTGIILHTGLGRAPISLELIKKGVYAKETHKSTIRIAPALTIKTWQIDNIAEAIREVIKTL